MNDKLIFIFLLGLIVGGIIVSISNQTQMQDNYWDGRLYTFQTKNITIVENNTIVDISIYDVCQRIQNLNNQEVQK